MSKVRYHSFETQLTGTLLLKPWTEALNYTRKLIDSNIIPPLLQIVTGALLTKSRNATADGGIEDEDEHHVHFDATPMEGQVFPLVQNEGIVALILICNGEGLP